MSQPSEELPQKYPIDFDAVERGRYWSPEELEQILETSKDSYMFSLLAQQFASRVERELASRGLHVVCRQDGRGVRVLTEDEAVPYCSKRAGQLIKGFFRTCQRQQLRDRSLLSPKRQTDLDRSLLEMAVISQSIRDGRKRLRMQDHPKPLPPP